MTFHCVACGRNVATAGRLRGFRMDDHTCICGGSLARGRGPADVPTVYAVPRRVAPMIERGLKRSTRAPQRRSA